ncbi:DUF2971 domain-containing protein [Draconibacterium halophilum]|uniref:DUF2971 domain-containing protein n=1 Tax=Draconibacterium halophilum TaxID=2706887 RepID=A0A6C0RBL0_9BACT|nr:DUF2971 domain-containing protein [Draconibacterium halophilum]QIA06863.1 DUF2971 domain-containing protein [Draconibacterium halophilum]
MTTENVNPKRELLFHYTKFDSALFYILGGKEYEIVGFNGSRMRKGSLLLNPISRMNDIYEMRSNLKVISDDFFEKNEANNVFEYLKSNKIKILSFSKDNCIKRGFDNGLMWSFYGNDYKGVCLVFDKVKFDQCFRNQYDDGYRKNDDIQYGYKPFKPVTTKMIENQKIEKEDHFEIRISKYENMSAQIWEVLKKDERLDDIFFRKGEEWDKENEFRYLIYDHRGNTPIPGSKESSCFIDYEDSLIGIILGPDFENRNNKIELLKNFVGEKIRIYRSRFENNKVQLWTFGEKTQVDYNKALLTD